MIPVVTIALCYYLATQSGRAISTVPIISATYIFAPERQIFAAGMTCFVCIQILYFHPLLHLFRTFAAHKQARLTIRQYPLDELVSYCYSLLFFIAWMPEYIFLGLHAMLAITLFMGLLQFQYSIYRISQVVHGYKAWITLIRKLICFSSCCVLVAVPAFIPWSFIVDFVGARGLVRLYLLTLDPRLTHVAILEWSYAGLCWLSMSTLLYEIKHNKIP